jgi:hypothetical protein
MMRTATMLRLFITGTALFGALWARPETAAAQQNKTIIAAGFVDVFGGTDPNCPGCNAVYDPEDQARAQSDPLPAMEFVVRNGAGQELGRLTTSDPQSLGIQRAQFSVPPDEEEYVLELVADPTNWQLCPNEARTRRITQADFRLTSRTEVFHFTQGCHLADTPTPSPTVPGTTPVPTTPPGQPTARPTDGNGDDDRDDGDDGDDVAAVGVAPGLGRIRGVAFIDLNQDGAIGPGEPGLNDVKVNLGGGGLELSQITPANGTFNFEALGAGQYDVFIAPGPEWNVTTPRKYTVSVNGNDVQGVDFGLSRVGSGPAEMPAESAPRTARRLVIPAPGAGISLPATGLLALPASSLAGVLAVVLGLVAAAGVTLERRNRR